MNINGTLVENSEAIAEKLIEAIKQDEQITSSCSLSFAAVQDNLPAICQTVVQAISNHNLSLLAVCEQNQGSYHGYVRSKQDFEPEEIAREFFLLKQIVLAQVKPQLLTSSPETIFAEIALIDLVIERVMNNSFQTYAEAKKHQIDNLHQQIFLTNRELTRLIEVHQGSLSYLAHEIKNPLTSIIGYSDLFLRQQKNDNSISNLQHIQQVLRQGRKVLRLINDTLEISSYSEGKLRLQKQKFDVCSLIENIALGLKSSVEAKNLKLVINCSPTPLEIKSDSLRLEQIITNLLINAIRYTSSGSIELTCSFVTPELLEIKVADTGVGISKLDRERIFEPYFRSQQSQKTAPEGMGLGLAIVLQLVAMLEGEIKLISELDVGSTFIVTIPLATPSTKA